MPIRQSIVVWALLAILCLSILPGTSSRASQSYFNSRNYKAKPNLSLPSIRRSIIASDIKEPTSTSSSSTFFSTEPAKSSHPSLFTINALMLCFYATLGSVFPFLPVYYKRIGVSNVELGLLGAITPAVTFLVSPLWGAFADSSGKHKQIMLFTFVGSVLVRCLTVLCKGHVLWLGLVVGLSSVLYAPVKPLIDAAVMSIIKDKADYGRSRLYGQIGLGIGSMIVGPFLSNHLAWIFAAQLLLAIPTALIMASPSFALQPITFNEDEPMSDYTNNSNRYRYRMINVLAGLKTYLQDKVKLLQKKKEALSMEEEKPPVHVCKAITRVFRDSQVAVFFGVVFLIGVTSGVIENFAYLRISEIATASNRGASLGNILGVCRLLSSLAGGPMFWLSGRIVQGLGINGVLSLSLLAYILRFLIYAYAHNPWHTLPAEVLRGLTFAIFWSGCTYHVYAVSPRAFTATMLGLLNGVYGGLGQSLGAILGGEMCRAMGIAKTFQQMAIANAFTLLGYLLYEAILNVRRKDHVGAAQVTSSDSTAP